MRSFKAGDNVSGTVGGSFAHAIWNNRVNDFFYLEDDFNDVIRERHVPSRLFIDCEVGLSEIGAEGQKVQKSKLLTFFLL